MDEPILRNRSPFRVDVLPILDTDGAHARLVLVKATFTLAPGRAPDIAEEQQASRLGDVPWGQPDVADLRLPADYAIAKVGSDFVVAGHAVAPRPQSETCTDVAIRVAQRTRQLRVHGPRRWQRALEGIVPGPAAPMFDPVPLAWSLAWGGQDFEDPARPLEEPRNPVGRGIARRPERLVGTPAPQIEWVEHPIGVVGDRQEPAGCAPLGRHFEPRRGAAGTHDAQWLDRHYPARPADYQASHENCAAAPWRFDAPLRGGEPVSVVGASADGPLDFLVPKWRIVIHAAIAGGVQERRPVLDTVIVDADQSRLELVWRAVFRCPGRAQGSLTAVQVGAKEFVA